VLDTDRLANLLALWLWHPLLHIKSTHRVSN
jgi:hypothetical protein